MWNPDSEYPLKALDILDQIDREDAFVCEPVVHCYECKYRLTELFDEPRCLIVRDCDGENTVVKDSDYCSWGEKRL